MNIDKIIDKMAVGVILLEYTSLRSGEHKVREVTTCREYIPKEKRAFDPDWRQRADDQKLLCFDLEFGRWDDIDRDTIVKWKEMEGNFKVKMAKMTDLNWDGNV